MLDIQQIKNEYPELLQGYGRAISREYGAVLKVSSGSPFAFNKVTKMGDMDKRKKER
jgi:hypothetical protein